MCAEKFIYVFSADARDKMSELGYVLVKSDPHNCIYVFENNPRLSFSKLDISTIKSNTLTF